MHVIYVYVLWMQVRTILAFCKKKWNWKNFSSRTYIRRPRMHCNWLWCCRYSWTNLEVAVAWQVIRYCYQLNNHFIKVKWSLALLNKSSHSYEPSLAIWDHTLWPNAGETAPPNPSQTCWYSIYLLHGMEGWVDLGDWLHAEMACSCGCQQAVNDPGSNRARRWATRWSRQTTTPCRHPY